MAKDGFRIPERPIHTISHNSLYFPFRGPYFSCSKPRILNQRDMIEVINLEGMPVYKYRTQESDSFTVSELEKKGLPCGIYFVRIQKNGRVETAKLLIC